MPEYNKNTFNIYIDHRQIINEYILGGVCPNYAPILTIIKIANEIKNSGVMMSARMYDFSRAKTNISSITLNRPNINLLACTKSIINNILELCNDKPTLTFTDIVRNGDGGLIIIFET